MKKPARETTPWLGKHPVLSEDDHPALEAGAAIKEFREGMPRAQAESSAHGDYIRGKALDAAAHHLLGLRAAHAAEDPENAQKHAMAYQSACNRAGIDHAGQPAQEVLDRIRDARPKVYDFKDHPADRLMLAMAQPEDPSQDLATAIARVRDLGKRLGTTAPR